MNIQHSSRSDEWYTPVSILDRVRAVLGPIDFDPASDAFGNSRVQALRYLTREDDGLISGWGAPNTIFLNPPGGKCNNKSRAALFWGRLMAQRADPGFGHAIFMAFSLEQLQTTQASALSIMDFPFAVPKRRIVFDQGDGRPGEAPSHSNVIAYVPGRVDVRGAFAEAFQTLGAVRL